MRMLTGNTVGLCHVRATPTRDGTPLKGMQLYTRSAIQWRSEGPSGHLTCGGRLSLSRAGGGGGVRRGGRGHQKSKGEERWGKREGKEERRGSHRRWEAWERAEEGRQETVPAPGNLRASPSRTGCDSCLTWACSCFTHNGQGRGLSTPTAGPKLKDSAPRQTDLCNYEIRKKNLLDFVIRVILSWRLITQLSLSWRYTVYML